MTFFQKLLALTLSLLLALTLIACDDTENPENPSVTTDQSGQDTSGGGTTATTTAPTTTAPTTTAPVTTVPSAPELTVDQLLSRYFKTLSETVTHEKQKTVTIEWSENFPGGKTEKLVDSSLVRVDGAAKGSFAKLTQQRFITGSDGEPNELKTDVEVTLLDGMAYIQSKALIFPTILSKMTAEEFEDSGLLDLSSMTALEAEDPRSVFNTVTLNTTEEGYTLLLSDPKPETFVELVEEPILLPMKEIAGFSDYSYDVTNLEKQLVFDKDGKGISASILYELTMMADGIEFTVHAEIVEHSYLGMLTKSVTLPENAEDYLPSGGSSEDNESVVPDEAPLA